MRAALFASIWMALATCAFSADSPPARLAVISDADDQAFAALLVTELSGNPDISLVERDDLAKVGDELKLQQMAGSDAVALGKLIGADGLIFINRAPDGFVVRFTAVGLGYALLDDQIPSGTEIVQLAKSMANRIATYAPKLKLDPGKAIPISVLNLRADYGTAASVILERKLTLLFESRLASLPQYIVLERRHGWSLGFEHALSTRPPAAFARGLRRRRNPEPPAPKRGCARRHHSPSPTFAQQPADSLEIRGPVNDPHDLVEKMTSEIQKTTGIVSAATPWQPEKEAREYLEEGIWGWRNDADDAALEALDSAELLGETAPDLIAVRIAVLYQRASQALDLAKKDSSGPVPSGIPSLDQPIDDTLRAIADAALYDSEKLEPKLQLLTWEQNMGVRTDQIKENLSNFTSDFLVFLDSRNSPRADELRQALRAITGYDPLHGKLGRADMSLPLNVLTDSKDEWDLTLPEELAYYHLLATTPHQFIPPDLLTGQGKGFCQRFLKTREEQQEAFDHLVEDLKTNPNGKVTYQLIRSCSPDKAEADAAYTAYWKEMWNQREELVTQKVQVEEWTSARPVPDILRRSHAREMIPLLHYYLTHVNNYRDWEYSWETMWQPDKWSEDEAASIWSDYLGFKERAEADQVARGRNPLSLTEVEEPFEKKFPQIAQTKTPDHPSEPLIVDRLWCPFLEPGSPKEHSNYITQCQVAPDDTLWMTVWFAMSGDADRHLLFNLKLPDFEAKTFAPPETMESGGRLAVTSDAAFLCDYARSESTRPDQHKIARFDLKTQTWTTRTLVLKYENSFAVHDSLYFDLKGGIERYDWYSEKFTLLASSRRKPAQNQLDDCEPYMINSIFAGPGEKPCVSTLEAGIYYISDHPGNWTSVFDSCFWTQSISGQKKTLIYGGEGEVVLLDPTQPEPRYLMSPTEPHYRKPAVIHRKSVKEMTPWAGQTLWDAQKNIPFGSFAGGDDDYFFQLLVQGDSPTQSYDPTRSYELLWYDRDHGRKPRHIPLQFVMDDKTYAALPLMYRGNKGDHWSRETFQQPGQGANLSVFPTNDGICLDSDNLGIWFLSFRDIDAYLNTHREEGPSPQQTSPVSVKLPPPDEDAESQVIGDMIDPAIRATSFR